MNLLGRITNFEKICFGSHEREGVLGLVWAVMNIGQLLLIYFCYQTVCGKVNTLQKRIMTPHFCQILSILFKLKMRLHLRGTIVSTF